MSRYNHDLQTSLKIIDNGGIEEKADTSCSCMVYDLFTNKELQ